MKTLFFILYFALLLGCNKNESNDCINNCILKCTQIPNEGPCNLSIQKYYFNIEKLKCDTFIWGGCEGVVPFNTRAECESCGCK